MSVQSNVLYDVPEERRRQGYGRAVKLIIDGEGGGIWELWFCETGLELKPPEVPIKNIIYMSEDTLLNMITPDIEFDTLVSLIEKSGSVESATQRLYPRLDFRTALANWQVLVDGDTADVDSEEWSQLIENFLLKIAFPLVIRGLLRRRKK